jgi:putative membrane protein
MMFTRGFGSFGTFCRGFGTAYPALWLGLAALFVAALVVVIVLLVKKSHKSSNGGAADALKLRYIKGELTEEEYLKMKDVLGK